MNLLPSAEQEEIVASAASFLTGAMPITRVRELLAQRENVDSATWRACGELGWFALGLPEADGGVGGTLADEALLLREVGRSLAPGPYAATLLGARVAVLGGAPELAALIAGGTEQVGLAAAEGELSMSSDRVSGALLLLDAVGADHVLIATPQGAALVATTTLTDVVEAQCIDEATRLATARADSAPTVAFVAESADPVHRRGLVIIASMLVGIGEATRDIAVEHAKARVQFDRPIGAHQAVKHPCADMAVRCEAAWAQTVVAALAHDEGRFDADDQVASAWLVAADAAERNAAAALQVLGGMGFTFEHEVNLYVKRAHVLSRAFADRRALLDRLVDRT